MLIDKDKYLTAGERKKKIASASRVLGFLVKYSENLANNKEKKDGFESYQTFLKRELEANKDLSFDFFRRTTSLKENLYNAMKDLDTYLIQRLYDFLSDEGCSAQISTNSDSVWATLDPSRKSQTMEIDILNTKSLYIENCKEEIANKVYGEFLPDVESMDSKLDTKALLNTLIDEKWVKSGLTPEKRALFDDIFAEHRGFHKTLCVKANEVIGKVVEAEALFEKFLYKNIEKVFAEEGYPAVQTLESNGDVSFSMEKQDDSLYDDQNGYCKKLEYSEDGRFVWLDNVTEEIYNKIVDTISDREMPEEYYVDLMAELDKELAKLKEEEIER